LPGFCLLVDTNVIIDYLNVLDCDDLFDWLSEDFRLSYDEVKL